MRTDEFIIKRGDDFPFCVTLVDTSLKDEPLVYVNEALRRLTGYCNQELIGKNCRVLQNGQGNPEGRKAIKEAIRESKPVCTDLINFKKNGEKFYNRVLIFPFGGPFFLGLQNPISEEMFGQFTSATYVNMLESINSISLLLLSDKISEDEYKARFEEATQQIRNFILQKLRPY